MEQASFFDMIAQYPQISDLLHHSTGPALLDRASTGLSIPVRELEGYPARIQAPDGTPLTYGAALEALVQNADRLDWLYLALADKKSRLVLHDRVLAQLLPDIPPDRLPIDAGTYPFYDADFLPGKLVPVVSGCEVLEALAERQDELREELPALIVRLQPRLHQLWLIPRLLRSVCPDYRLYLRYSRPGPEQSCCLYAVRPQPPEAPAGPRTVLPLCYERGWHNAELVKDRICIPFLFHKLYGYEVRLIGERVDADYSNLDYLPGLTMDFVDCWDNQAKYRYLEAHAAEVDLLALPECQYGLYAPLVQLYKQKNPAGKVLLTLDANSGWADRVPQEDPGFRFLMDSSDAICASSRSIQTYLNAKWPWPIEYMPNGFYDFSHSYRPPVFEEKENVILTVGRLGTLAKATDTLLTAFARAADKLPDWTLRLVGPVDPSFRPWLEDFFAQHPDLTDRIVLTGPILDRDRLSQEYRRAKVFALSSRFEGTPNVMAEAMVHGCAVCCTTIDACADAIDHGRCGTWAEIDDVNGFALALFLLCTSPHLKEFSERACRLGRTDLDMERAVARLHHMLFGEEGR